MWLHFAIYIYRFINKWTCVVAFCNKYSEIINKYLNKWTCVVTFCRPPPPSRLCNLGQLNLSSHGTVSSWWSYDDVIQYIIWKMMIIPTIIIITYALMAMHLKVGTSKTDNRITTRLSEDCKRNVKLLSRLSIHHFKTYISNFELGFQISKLQEKHQLCWWSIKWWEGTQLAIESRSDISF